MIHISKPFVAKPEEVFVETEGWQLCPKSETDGRRIIPCSLCDKPAAQLDHHWPYSSVYNYCTFHAAPTGWAQMRWGRKWHWIEGGKHACSVDLRYSGRVRPAKDRPNEETICKRCAVKKTSSGGVR